MRNIGLIFALLIAGILCSCKSVQYVPVETVKTDTMWQNRIEHDSVYIHDSISIIDKGDTIRLEYWRTKYKEKIVYDTVYVSRTDSIQVPYAVERKLTMWEQIKKVSVSLIVLGLFVLVIFVIVVWITRAKRRL